MNKCNKRSDYNFSNYPFSSSHPLSVSLFSFQLPASQILYDSLCYHTIRSDRERLGGDWPSAWLSLRNDPWPRNWQLGSVGWGGGGSTSRWASSLEMKPNSHWLNCWGPQEPFPPPKPHARDPLPWLFVLNWPGVNWDYPTHFFFLKKLKFFIFTF